MKKRGRDDGHADRVSRRRDGMTRIDLLLHYSDTRKLNELAAAMKLSRTAVIAEAIRALHHGCSGDLKEVLGEDVANGGG